MELAIAIPLPGDEIAVHGSAPTLENRFQDTVVTRRVGTTPER